MNEISINNLIEELKKLSKIHGGETHVTVWQYGGGLDDLCNVEPCFDEETNTIVLSAIGMHESGARR